MRMLVVGGTGFIGPHVVRRLCEMGHEVTIFHRGRHEVDLPPDVRHIHHETEGHDRLSVRAHADELREARPEVALHMVPLGERDALELMDTFRGVARRVVAVSSQDVYRAYGLLIGTESGDPEPLPLREDSPLREKLYPYRGETPRAADDPQRWTDDYDKIVVERIVMGDAELPGTVVRLPAVYGPGDRQHRLFPYVKRMDDGRRAILLSEEQAAWRWGHGYVENMAHAIALAVTSDQAAGRIYNAGESENPTTAEWVRRIGSAVEWRGEIAIVPAGKLPEHLQPKANLAQSMYPDTSRIRAELGYCEQVGPDEALRRAIEWEHGRPREEIDEKEFDYDAEDALLRELGTR